MWQVQPFASLVRRVPPLTPRLLINRQRVGLELGLDFDACFEAECGDEASRGAAAQAQTQDVRSQQGVRSGSQQDVFYAGDCDDGVRELCRLMEWEAP